MAYGKAIKIPRTEVHNCDREDMKGAGVYFLFCQEEDGDASVYIGEAENVLERLNQHLRDYQTGKENISGIPKEDSGRYFRQSLLKIFRKCTIHPRS